MKLRHKLSTKNNFTKTKLKVDLKQKDGYTLHLYHHTAACPQMRSYNNIRPDLKYVGSPSTDRVYKKRAGQKISLEFIPEKKFFSRKYIINND